MAEFEEWEIENFSCWNCNIHGDGFEHDGITLYRRPVERKGDYLVVSMDNSVFNGVSKLSFIGSDGSVICTRQPVRVDEGTTYLIFTGPSFKELAFGIRRNEPLHKDRLILRWDKLFSRDKLCHVRKRTVINAYSAFFHIKPEVFDSKTHSGNPKNWNSIYNINFCFRYKNYSINVSACESGSTLANTHLKFKLKSNADEIIPTLTSVWMLNGDNIMQKFYEYCVLNKGRDHILRFGVPLKELHVLQTIVRCKIIAPEPSQNFGSISDLGLSPNIRVISFSGLSEIESLGNAVYSDAIRVSDLFPGESQPENTVADLTNDYACLFLGESQRENTVSALTKDFMCLFQDHDFSDFEIRCGATSFPTHRNILSARSPVLKAMLAGGMREAASGHMDIKDLDPHTLGRFLAFLYSGTSVENLEWESALRLYYAGDKYQVPSLKSECFAVLRASVSLESVCYILSLADNHQDEELRSVAHNFILKNFNAVLESEEWEKLMKRNSLLVAKTVTHLAKNKYVKKSDPYHKNYKF